MAAAALPARGGSPAARHPGPDPAAGLGDPHRALPEAAGDSAREPGLGAPAARSSAGHPWDVAVFVLSFRPHESAEHHRG